MDTELKAYLDDIMAKLNLANERILNRLTSIESEVRELRAQSRALHADMASRAYIGARAVETEGFVQGLFARLNERLDQTERSVEERLIKLEKDRA